MNLLGENFVEMAVWNLISEWTWAEIDTLLSKLWSGLADPRCVKPHKQTFPQL